jgi:hypothetical protein
MIEDYENKKRKQIGTMRSLLDYGIGGLIMLAGIFFIVRSQFDLDFNKTFPPSTTDILFGAVCLLYGGWRIYRGYKKNYFK